ncbi:MAG: hypothetical protein AAF213_13565 [Pseudomonadota bacterium]
MTAESWREAAQAFYRVAQPTIEASPTDPDTLPAMQGLFTALNPYERPDLSPTELDQWRQLDFALEDGQKKAAQQPKGVDDTDQPAPCNRPHILPLVEFYIGLTRIDQRVASMYDGDRYEKIMKICIGIGAILLLATIGTAIVEGFDEFDWSEVPLEGSLGVLCGFGLGILLDARRRSKTRALIEEWGATFGCDLKGMRWRQIPVLTDRIGQELTRLGGGYWVALDQAQREQAFTEAAKAANYHPVDTVR